MSLEILEEIQGNYPDLAENFNQQRSLFGNKYWHQYGEELLVLTFNENIRSSDDILKIHKSILNNATININPIILAQLTITASKRLTNLEEQLEFIKKTMDIVHHEEAKILIELQKAYCHFEAGQNELGTAGDILKAQLYQIEKLTEVEPIVWSTYYKYMGMYHLKRKDYSVFYFNSLQFLSYVDQKSFSNKEREELCINMGIAIFISKKIFNYSELLELKIFQVLKEGPYSFMYKMMETFNGGDVDQFRLDMVNYNDQIKNITILDENRKTLEEKIKIMAFTELIFGLQKNDRVVTFAEISQRTSLSMEEVEFMVQRAMSLELIKGQIDQVDQKVNVTFIQPRVLDKARIGTMRGKFGSWENGLKDLLGVITHFQESIN